MFHRAKLNSMKILQWIVSSEWLFSWGVPCLGRLTVLELCVPKNRRCFWLRPALHGRSTSDRFMLEWHYLCEKMSIFRNFKYFHLWVLLICIQPNEPIEIKISKVRVDCCQIKIEFNWINYNLQGCE